MYLVVDCYPRPGSRAFRSYAGAVARCWIRVDLCVGGAGVDAIAKQKLHAAGWDIARTLVRETVSSGTYADKHDGWEFFEQAQIDGFVAKFDVVPRGSIGNSDLDDDEAIAALGSIVGRIRTREAVSLYSARDQQWANGVTDAAGPFVPLWLTRYHALEWVKDWPGYDIRSVPGEAVSYSAFLEEINDADMWIGLGVGTSLLMMCHPIWIRDATELYLM